MDLFWGERGGGLGEDLKDRPTAWSGLEARLFQWVGGLGVGVTHGGCKVERSEA